MDSTNVFFFQKHCERQKESLRIRYKPSLFQHVGTHSSLAGKIQNLKDKDFGKQVLYIGHPNPPATIKTTLKAYQKYTFERAYNGEDYFWAFSPEQGDSMTIVFNEPLIVESYFFRSGNIEHPSDKLLDTIVEVLPEKVTYKTPVPVGEVYFSETFDHGSLDGWYLSKTKKGETDDEIAKYDGKWAVEPLKENAVSGDKGLLLKSRAKHHAIASMVKKPFVFDKDPLVVQYEVNFQDGIDCGGAYMKLLTASDDLNLEQFFDRTPYTIMFGPDKCGEDYKLHFIFRHKSPITGEFEEKHAKRPEVDLKKYYTDKKTHLYTLVLNPDNTFEIFIDQNSVSTGSLFEDMVPPVNPPKEIDDPNDSKPDDWDERPKIPDPDASKPDDWDENVPAKIEDLDAVKPEGWLDDEPEYISDPNAEKPVDW
ncbi:CALX protein, partial [Polypterus senegalus]